MSQKSSAIVPLEFVILIKELISLAQYMRRHAHLVRQLAKHALACDGGVGYADEQLRPRASARNGTATLQKPEASK